MNKLLLAPAALLFLWGGCAVEEGAKYGEPLTLTDATNVDAILADPSAYEGKRVLVEGEITEVCEMMGCWIMVRDGDGLIRFKVDDGVIKFPMDAKGKRVRAEGVVSVNERSVEQQISDGQHHADETGTEFDESSVTGPKLRIQIEGAGAVVI